MTAENRSALVEQGVLPVIFGRVGSDDSNIQQATAKLLWNLVKHDQSGKEAIYVLLQLVLTNQQMRLGTQC